MVLLRTAKKKKDSVVDRCQGVVAWKMNSYRLSSNSLLENLTVLHCHEQISLLNERLLQRQSILFTLIRKILIYDENVQICINLR